MNTDMGTVIGIPLIINSLLLGAGLAMDALSVGFTTADYSVLAALISSLIIGVVRTHPYRHRN